MEPLIFPPTPAEVAKQLGERVRAARRLRRWTQAELARRSGVSVATIARFEQDGHGQVATLLHLADALRQLGDFDAVLAAPAPATLADLRRQVADREAGRR